MKLYFEMEKVMGVKTSGSLFVKRSVPAAVLLFLQ